MNKSLAIGVGGLLLVVFLLFSTTYTVKYNEIAVKATFGSTDASSVITEPGLHFRLPIFIDSVSKLDRRLQVVESPLEELVTADATQVVARAFLLWRVDDDPERTLAFLKQHETIDGAADSLNGQFRTAFTAGLSEYRFDELVGPGSRLAEAEERIRAAMAPALAQQGIEPVAVGISQLMLPPRTSRAVVERMKAERDVLRDSENRKGAAEAQRLQAEANTAADKILAFANQRAEEIRAEAEQASAEYLERMSRTPEDEQLAIFLEWLDAIERSLNQFTTVILPTDAAPFHLLSPNRSGAGDGVVPQPPSGGGASGRAASAAPAADGEDTGLGGAATPGS